MGTNQLEPTISSATTTADSQDEQQPQSAAGDVRRRNNQTTSATSTTAEGTPLVTFNERRIGTNLIFFFLICFVCHFCSHKCLFSIFIYQKRSLLL